MDKTQRICQYCKAEFAYKRTLDKHLKTAGYCLKKREEQRIGLLSQQVQEYEEKISSLNKSLLELKEENSFLKGQLNILKIEKERYYTTVEKAALKDTTTNKNNNQYNNLLTFPVLDKQRMDEKCKLLNANIVRSGQKALANFFVNKIATNDKGELGVICTDKSRRTFKYLREDGKIVTDIEAENIIKNFKASSIIHIEKSLDQIKREYESDELYETEEEQLDSYYKVAAEARAFGGPFLAQLIKKTYRKEEGGKLVKIEPPKSFAPTPEEVNEVIQLTPEQEAQFAEWEKYMN